MGPPRNTLRPAEQADLLEVVASESSARYASPRPFREWQPEQGQLLPRDAREVLGEGHLACFFVDLRKALDFSSILGAYTKMREQTRRVDRAGLLRRAFDVDAFACARCGGRRQVLAYLTSPR